MESYEVAPGTGSQGFWGIPILSGRKPAGVPRQSLRKLCSVPTRRALNSSEKFPEGRFSASYSFVGRLRLVGPFVSAVLVLVHRHRRHSAIGCLGCPSCLTKGQPATSSCLLQSFNPISAWNPSPLFHLSSHSKSTGLIRVEFLYLIFTIHNNQDACHPDKRIRQGRSPIASSRAIQVLTEAVPIRAQSHRAPRPSSQARRVLDTSPRCRRQLL